MTIQQRHAAAAVEIAATVFRTDARGLGACRGLLPGDAYARAAVATADRRPGQAMLLTGFPVGGVGETDGPPGTMAVGQALTALGWNVVTVACETTFPVVDALLADLGPVIAAPCTERGAQAACEALRREYAPDLAVAIERPGTTADGRRLNMRGEDITGIAAALDPLMRAPLSVAVGDGGNEIGMGAIAPYLEAKGVIPGVSVTRAAAPAAGRGEQLGRLRPRRHARYRDRSRHAAGRRHRGGLDRAARGGGRGGWRDARKCRHGRRSLAAGERRDARPSTRHRRAPPRNRRRSISWSRHAL